MSANIAEMLEPYRGKRGLLKKDLGMEGIRMLHVHPEVCGSPSSACEFLGYAQSSLRHFSDDFTMLQLPVNKRDWAEHAQKIQNGFLGGMSTQEKIDAYIRETSRPEMAPVFDWKLPKDTEFGMMVILSDVHWGAHETDAARFMRLVDWIGENPDVRWVGLGDWLNVSTKNSVSSPDLLPYDAAFETLAEVVRPIAKQGTMILDGNHEGRIAKELKLHISPMREMVKELGNGLHYGGMSEFLRMRLAAGKNQQEYDGFCHHGFGGAATPGGKINYLFRQFSSLTCDFLAMGHTHSLTVQEQIRVGLTRTIVNQNGRDYVEVQATGYPLVFAGSFQKHQRGSYARNKGLSPASLGAATLHFYTGEHDVHARQ